MVREALKGRYEVDRELARGGAARVFLARDTSGSAVALKILHPELAVSVTAERFLREISFLSDIDHPNIASLTDYGESDWLVYYVMTYVPGPTLREHLRRVKRASLPDTCHIAVQLLDALKYAHEMGIVHRDVKPENVVLASTGPVLMDFGIAKVIASSGNDRLTRSGFAVGTSSYMSPEQVAGAEDIDHRSDLYSLGCVLFECLAGRPPFTSAREELVLSMHHNAEAPAVTEFRGDVSEGLARIVARALNKDREERWQSAAEMREAVMAI
ncbi:MAG: serine/threonine-protein kinase [Gemmatimonadales bacterium]